MARVENLIPKGFPGWTARHLPRSVPIPHAVPATLGSADRAGDDYAVGDTPNWRTVDWLPLVKRIDLLDTPIEYVDLGPRDGLPPIVFIHGIGGQWQNWLENLPRIAQTRRVVALDLPGFGESPMPAEPITIGYYGRVVAQLCERLDLAPAVVVGNSMGGYVAAELAIAWPELVERLMLVSAAGVSQADLFERPLMIATKAAALVASSRLTRLRFIARRAHLRHWALQVIARHPNLLRSDMAFEGMIKGTGKPGFESGVRACLEYDFRERLPNIGCPTLVLWGGADMIIPVSDADRFVELIPGARKLVFADTGHVPMIERPVTFNEALLDFLEYEITDGELEGELDDHRERVGRPRSRRRPD